MADARITHVAVRFRGVTYSLPGPNRHHHVRKETPRARKIRDWFARHVPEARVKWGIIHTER